MNNIFMEKLISPMLIGAESGPFDDEACIFELKLDGIRGLAYLDKDTCELRNKRNMRVSAIYPELDKINKQVKQRCILDGEFVIMRNSKPDFFEMQKRALMSNQVKISLAASRLPVSFIVYDILYIGKEQITDWPLMERKNLLNDIVQESRAMAISRYIDTKGINLYRLAEERALEGVVAKRKTSKYYCGKRSKDWVKIKYLKDEDYVICGYIHKDKGMTSLVLGQYNGDALVYKGHVTLGVAGYNLKLIQSRPKTECPFQPFPAGNEKANWIKPLVGTVNYMPRGEVKSQPVFKGLRNDKSIYQCVEN